jgi:hypothetical protein
MFKNNPWLIKALGILFFGGLFGLLFFYFDTSLTELGIMLLGGVFSGLFFGITVSSFFSYVNPSDWLFQYRYTLEGIGWGLFLGSITMVTSLSDDQAFGASDVIIPLLIGCIFGITWIKLSKHKRLKKRVNSFMGSNRDPIIFSDAGTLTGVNHAETKGIIVLTENKILFSPNKAEEQKFELALSKTNPRLKKSSFGFLNMPTGIQLTVGHSIKPAKFPRYWLQKIKYIQFEAEPRKN